MRCPLVRTVWPGQLPKSFVCPCSFGARGHPKLHPTIQRRAKTNTEATAHGNTNAKNENTYRNDAVRVGTSRLRENAVPRHWPAKYLMLITVRLQNMCRTCLVLCVFSSIKGQTPHRRGLEQMLTTPSSPMVLCARSACSTNADMSRTSPSSLL